LQFLHSGYYVQSLLRGNAGVVEASSANRLLLVRLFHLFFATSRLQRSDIKNSRCGFVTFANWFGGVYMIRINSLARLAVDAQTIFNV